MPQKIEKVYVISHTHWDREWYQDFQGYRIRLIYLIDELIDKMEQDGAYRHFMMDGQTIVLDDYLDIRPENRERLLKLIQDGRISIGPWYVMPDEFLVSGESLIRNLQIGHRRSRSFGVQPMKSGYITDIFGHNSQFPQILQGFEINNAVLFRGFYGDADASEMWWEGADGSRVLGLKLDEDRSYGDFYFFIRWPFADREFQYDREELITRAKAMLDYKSKRATTSIIAGFDGVDHIEIEPQLPWILETLNEADLDAKFEHCSLAEYVSALRGEIGELRIYQGEQRSPGFNGVNNWVLANVLSSRIHLKMNNQACEVLLEKWAEPWGVFTALKGRSYPKTLLAKAWEYLIQNHPHDSICGCSIDQVHRDMLYRFDQSRLIAEGMVREQLLFISNHHGLSDIDGDQIITVFNASQSPIDGVIEVEFAIPTLSDAVATMFHLGGTSFRLYDHEGNEIPYQLLELSKNSTRMWRPYRDIPYSEQVDRCRIAFQAQVPSYGYAVYVTQKKPLTNPGPGDYHAPTLTAPVRLLGFMRMTANTWENGRLRVAVLPNGTIDVTDVQTGRCYSGLLLLEDEADIGEGWNHVSPVTNEVFTSYGSSAQISVVYDGPLQTRIRIRTSISIPHAIHPQETRRSEVVVAMEVTTFLELRKNDPILRCRTVINNRARDHRLRLLFPSGLQTEHFYTSTPFDYVKRNIQPPDYTGYMEKARDVVPHQGILTIDDGRCGLAIYSKGLYEAAVRNDELRTVALTLFRSTGKEVLSDGGDGGQLLTELEFHYAISPFAVTESHTSRLWHEHQQFVAGIRSVDRKLGKVVYESLQRREADLSLSHSFLQVSSAELIVSAIKVSEERNDSYVIRLFNISDEYVEGSITFDRKVVSAHYVNLDEELQTQASFTEDVVSVAAKAKQIISIQISF
ncbi:glycosyl hydrolase-related protein [Paenibacillus sp. LjRoot153]|uniref:alpha-mannosidase n=1 Tax=Paenibacillus sp. LjRoot153 TaxID=3342270 RepID=UPI003ECD6DDE